MGDQYKEMSPADVQEQKMRDKMGKAADKAKENSLGAKTDKSIFQKALEFVDPSLKNMGANTPDRDTQAAKSITTPSYEVNKKAKGGMVHHSEHYKKHAAGHMIHMDHVKKNFRGK